MFQVGKYAYANAKIRALVSYLLEPALFQQMLEVKTAAEVLSLLKSTRYGSMPDFPKEESVDFHSMENVLVRNDIALHAKVSSCLSSKEKKFIALLLQRYEIEELKVVLRLWHKKASVNWKDYVSGIKICFDMDFDQVLSAGSIEEIILLLDNTPYRTPLLRAKEKFKERNSLFYLETALDIDYFERAVKAAKELSSLDKSIAQKILGIEIDIENINWLIRMRKYYSLAMGDMLEWIIPGGSKITKENLRNFYVSDGVGKLVDSLALGPYEKIKDMVEDNFFLIENFLYEILLKEVKKAFAGFPFTIGIPLGYLILKRKETQKIISILYAKNYGWEKEKISSLIIV
jgi:V/A-type H+/Na+-transporting ATPase subunit C